MSVESLTTHLPQQRDEVGSPVQRDNRHESGEPERFVDPERRKLKSPVRVQYCPGISPANAQTFHEVVANRKANAGFRSLF